MGMDGIFPHFIECISETKYNISDPGARHWHINGYDIHQDLSEFLITNSSNIYSYKFPPSSNAYFLFYESIDDKTGHVILAKMNYLNASASEIYSVRSDNISIFVETNKIGKDNKKPENISVTTQISDPNNSQNIKNVIINSDKIRISVYQKDWQILTIDNFYNINPQSLFLSNT